MSGLPGWTSVSLSLVGLGLSVFAVDPLITVAQTATQSAFPDVAPDYWAQPFIARLAQRNVVTGYPDGTYRPEESVDRDEFAAIIRKAFSQDPTREIATGSVYKDIPAGYWADDAIEEAYQQGFMTGYPGGYFRPRQPVSKVEAIVALSNGLNLGSDAATPAAAVPPATAQAATAAAPAPVTISPAKPGVAPVATQPTRRRVSRRPIFLPLAVTSLMQPLLVAKAADPVATATPDTPVYLDLGGTPTAATPKVEKEAAAPVAAAAAPVAADGIAVDLNRPASFIITNAYQDSNKIPQYAVADLALATKAGLVVNYPNPKVLNPTEPATRAEIAAIVYQTLVAQGKAEPIPANVAASNYIVGRGTTPNQNAQTAQ